MIRFIDGFHQDDEGDWVAELSCLHNQHVRHRPPFREQPWVLGEAGRDAHLRTQLDCPLCDRAELPSGLEVVRTAGPFDAATMPAALRRAHRVADRTWGTLRVFAGTVQLAMETSPRINVRLSAGDAQPIPPGVPHAVCVDGPMCVVIEFARKVVPEPHTRKAAP